MESTSSDWLARYRPWRRQAEIGFWVLVLGLEVVFNTLVAWIDVRRDVPGFPLWRPAVWEVTSTLAIGILIPAVVAFERRFPVRWDTLRRNVPLHLGATVAFSLAHVALMMPLRKLLHAAI